MIVNLDCYLILSNIKWLKAQAVGHYKLSKVIDFIKYRRYLVIGTCAVW